MLCGRTVINHNQIMYNGEHVKAQRFSETFATICCNHHLGLSTQRSYWHWAKHLIKWAGIKSASQLSEDSAGLFTRFLSKLANDDVAEATQAQAWNALVFLFEKVVGVQLGQINGVTRATRQQRFIDVPEPDQAKRIVESVRGDVGLALRLIYGTAMRLNDALRLRVKDLDFKRKQIAVQESKGGKARLVPMPESLATELAALVAERERIHAQDLEGGFGWVHLPHKLATKYPGDEKSIAWQFVFASDRISRDPRTGNFGRHHLMDVTLQSAMRKARDRLHFKRRYSVHSLRHCTAQFWERSGVATSDIARLLGHSSIETTARYLRSGKSGMPKVPTPI